MDVVYHGSPEAGLTVLAPRASAHGRGYLYATRNKPLSLLYLQPWNDFVFDISYANGLLELTERKPGMLEETYMGRGGYIYHLSAEHFRAGLTGFREEVISDRPASVIGCEEISNCYPLLLCMVQDGQMNLYRYPDRPWYIPEDDHDLVEKAVHFYETLGDISVIRYCASAHPRLRDRLALELRRLGAEEGLDG